MAIKQLAGKLILPLLAIEAHVKIVFQIGHQQIEGFDIGVGRFQFVELKASVARDCSHDGQFAQNAFDGLLFARLIVTA